MSIYRYPESRAGPRGLLNFFFQLRKKNLDMLPKIHYNNRILFKQLTN